MSYKPSEEPSINQREPAPVIVQRHPPPEDTPTTGVVASSSSIPTADSTQPAVPAYKHPAVEAFVTVYGKRDIEAFAFALIAKRVGTSSEALERWRSVLDYWRSNNYSRKSVGKMLDCYDERAPKPQTEDPVTALRGEIDLLQMRRQSSESFDERRQLNDQIVVLRQRLTRMLDRKGVAA